MAQTENLLMTAQYVVPPEAGGTLYVYRNRPAIDAEPSARLVSAAGAIVDIRRSQRMRPEISAADYVHDMLALDGGDYSLVTSTDSFAAKDVDGYAAHHYDASLDTLELTEFAVRRSLYAFNRDRYAGTLGALVAVSLDDMPTDPALVERTLIRVHNPRPSGTGIGAMRNLGFTWLGSTGFEGYVADILPHLEFLGANVHRAANA